MIMLMETMVHIELNNYPFLFSKSILNGKTVQAEPWLQVSVTVRAVGGRGSLG